METSTGTKTIWERIRDRALENEHEPDVLTRDLLSSGFRDPPPTAEDVLAQLLWFLADPEAETSDDDLMAAVADATIWADRLGIQWRSGR